jgi:hypothetical protein
MLRRFVADRATVYCPLPPAGSAVDDKIDLEIRFPDSPAVGPDFGMTLHRIAITESGRADWLGYPNLNALLAELNSGDSPLAVHDLGSPTPLRPALLLPPDAVPRIIRTYFGTILYADQTAGRIRHGQAAAVPPNLFAIQIGEAVLLVRPGDNGGYVGVRVRPEGPHAPEDAWKLWSGGGFARSFAMVSNGGAPGGFCLRAAGLFAAAEPNGEFTLNRLQPGEWEGFHFE